MNIMERCEDCIAPVVGCDVCEYNIGITHSAGPCGQQNCWYGCTVCNYNHGCYHKDE